MKNRILVGDCRAQLALLPGECVQTVVTSPPYWGLRDYGVEGQIGLEPVMDCLGWATGAPCGECFICHIVDVFRAVRRVLKKDGTCWVNMGDAYAGGRGESSRAERDKVASRRRDDEPIPRSDVRVPGLKPKDMMCQPWRVAMALQADGWYLRQDIIWRKPNPMPETAKDRCTKQHEYLFLLSKSRRYYYDAEAIKEPCSPGTHARLSQDLERQVGSARANGGTLPGRPMKAVGGPPPSGWNHGPGRHDGIEGRYTETRPNGVGWGYGDGEGAKPRTQGRKHDPADGNKNNASFDAAMAVMPEDRNKRSVWDIPTESFKGAHFATFPCALVRPCILAGSRPGDLVLDPFGGSGTTAAVAQELARDWVICELSPSYAEIATDRIGNTHPGLAL